jgi:hypothetical protein
VSGKNNKILPIPKTMQGISTSAESKEERNKKKKKKKKLNFAVTFGESSFTFLNSETKESKKVLKANATSHSQTEL